MGKHTDWRVVIEGSGLPVEMQRVIEVVVRGTRLWKGERADVAMELVAHFADGLDAGQSVEQLLSVFGDPRKLARLIRRAKKRNRSWWWQAMMWMAQMVGVMMVVYVGLWGWLMTSRPEPGVDYVAKFNEGAEAVAAEDQAWPIYRQAWITGKIWDLKLEEVSDEEGRLFEPGDDGWGKVAGFLDEHRVLVDAARRGGVKRGLGLKAGFDKDYAGEDRLALFGPDAKVKAERGEMSYADRLTNESVMGVLLPHLAKMRTMSQLLVLDAEQAAERGDGALVAEDYRAMMGMARQARELPMLVNQLVAVAMMRQADRMMMRVMDDRAGALTTLQWIEAAHVAGGSADICRMELVGEKSFMDDFLQRFYSDDGHGDGHVTYDGLRMSTRMSYEMGQTNGGEMRYDSGAITSMSLPLAYMSMASRREVKDKADRWYGMLQERMDEPLWKQIGGEESVVQREFAATASSAWQRIRFMPLMMLMPALERAGQMGQKMKAEHEALCAAIGLELYQREHGGRYPQKLEELVPEYLPGMPVDHSTGKQLLYVLKERGGDAASEGSEANGKGEANGGGVMSKGDANNGGDAKEGDDVHGKIERRLKPVLYGRGLDGDDDGGERNESMRYGWAIPSEGDWVLYPAE